MKKYFLTMATIALFAVGFAASDEEESSSNESSATQTEQKQETEAEQKQETEAERKAREEKEQASEKEEENKKFAEFGYKLGYEKGFGANYHDYETLNWERVARIAFTKFVGAPSTPRDKEKYDIYLQNFKKGLEEGYKAQ